MDAASKKLAATLDRDLFHLKAHTWLTSKSYDFYLHRRKSDLIRSDLDFYRAEKFVQDCVLGKTPGLTENLQDFINLSRRNQQGSCCVLL